jgi:hypothetical protein
MTPEQKMLAIQYLVPGAEMTWRGEEMEWHDERPQPTEEEIAAALEAAECARSAELVRAERDRRLTACDAWALPDFPHPSEEVKTVRLAYRQNLRDVPDQPGFPHEIEWPEPPL